MELRLRPQNWACMSCWIKAYLKVNLPLAFQYGEPKKSLLLAELGFAQLVAAEKYPNKYKQFQQ